MMSRPIITRKIKHNNTVYNLELWNSIDDDYMPEPPAFRKDFFNDVDMSGSMTPANTSRYQDRFDNWFDKLPVHKQRQYARAIDEEKACPIYLKKTHEKTLKLISIDKLKKYAIDLS